MMRVRGSIPIRMALSGTGGMPKPASSNGRLTPSVGKVGRRFIACLMALLSIP